MIHPLFLFFLILVLLFCLQIQQLGFYILFRFIRLSVLNYAEIAFRQDDELECLKNYLSLEKPAQEVESFSMVAKSLKIL